MGKSQLPQDFSDSAFHQKIDVDENMPMTKNTDLPLNASGQILIKYIRVNVIHRASNCYLAQTPSALDWGTMTICDQTTEKNHSLC